MKIWIDDLRPAPEGYVWCLTTDEAKTLITSVVGLQNLAHIANVPIIEVIDIDHDAGDFACYGGDYIKLLDWLEENEYKFPIRIHSMNPVGVQNMRAIIQRNCWTEIR